jgi:hypothetical protein
MHYGLFEKAAAINSEFEVIPSKVSLLAKGIVIDKNGYMQYKGRTYLPNMVKLEDLPIELRSLFMEKKNQLPSTQGVGEQEQPKENKFEVLNKALYDQLKNIIEPTEGTDIHQELKKANTVCNIADKLINIADLSLKAEMLYEKRRKRGGQSLYKD